MKIKEISHVDDFTDIDDTKIYFILVEDVNEKYINEAKRIDGDDYLDNCFRIGVIYSCINKLVEIPELEYVDNNGNLHGMEVIKDNQLMSDIEELIKNDNVN